MDADTRVLYAITSPSIRHVSRHAIEAMERAFAQSSFGSTTTPLRNRPMRWLVGCLSRAGGVRVLRRNGRRAIVVPMMGYSERIVFPWTYTNDIVPIIFDCMPGDLQAWFSFFRKHEISLAFFTASQAVDEFRREFPTGRWHWLPEAIDIDRYRSDIPWERRGTDVLEFGRRFDRYHEAIVERLRALGYKHLYEETKGKLVFPSQEQFLSGLAGSRISVCLPQSRTHPERFGPIETLTQRYLESIASGCLLVGECPSELATLFGFDPVVPIAWDRPVEQLIHLLRHPELHEQMRARNLARLREVGSWRTRLASLCDVLSGCGYAVPCTNVATID